MTPTHQDLPRNGLAALCAAQTTSWGLLYYSLPVAVIPIVADTGWSATAVTGSFSAGLIVSAVVGIRIGRMLDRQGPRALMTGGSIVGTVALALAALAPNLPLFAIAWLLAGCAQAAVLYQPAFVVITRWYGPARLRALTTLTLVAGFASTISSPLTAILIENLGWRAAFLVLSATLAAVTLPLHWFFLNATWTTHPAAAPRSPAGIRAVTQSRRFRLLQVAMALTTLGFFAVTLNLIPLLLERGFDYRTAAFVFGLIGVGQVLGRLGYGALQKHIRPVARTVLLTGCGALVLAALGALSGPAGALVLVVLLAGMLRGCYTLLQATAVADRWGTTSFGTVQGVFIAPVTVMAALAPATGPFLAAQLGSYSAMALACAVLAAIAVAVATRT